MKHQKTISVSAIAALLALTAISGPSMAGDRTLDGSERGEVNATLEAPVVGLVAEEDVSEKKPKKVQMTNLANGEVGCHNNETQTSTPGGCWD